MEEEKGADQEELPENTKKGARVEWDTNGDSKREGERDAEEKCFGCDQTHNFFGWEIEGLEENFGV